MSALGVSGPGFFPSTAVVFTSLVVLLLAARFFVFFAGVAVGLNLFSFDRGYFRGFGFGVLLSLSGVVTFCTWVEQF